MRILVDPNVLRTSAQAMQRAVDDVRQSTDRALRTLSSMQWEAHDKPIMEQHAADARRRGGALSEQGTKLATSLRQTADRFEQADQAALDGIAQTSGGIQAWRAQWYAEHSYLYGPPEGPIRNILMLGYPMPVGNSRPVARPSADQDGGRFDPGALGHELGYGLVDENILGGMVTNGSDMVGHLADGEFTAAVGSGLRGQPLAAPYRAVQDYDSLVDMTEEQHVDDEVHAVLGVAGMATYKPVSIPANIANAQMYFFQGEYGEAIWAGVAAAQPGDIAKALDGAGIAGGGVLHDVETLSLGHDTLGLMESFYEVLEDDFGDSESGEHEKDEK